MGATIMTTTLELESQSNLDTTPFNLKIAEYFFRRLRPYFHGRILDLGCGVGVLTKMLVDAGFNVTGVDGSACKVETAKTHVADATFIVSLFEDLSFPFHKFDVVIMKNVLEHVEDPVLLLTKAKEWIGEDGIVIVFVPNQTALHRRLGVKLGLINSLDELTLTDVAVGHKQVFNQESLLEVFSKAHYQILKVGSLVLKPLPNNMMQLLSDQVCEGFYRLAEDPDLTHLCSGIYVVGEPTFAS